MAAKQFRGGWRMAGAIGLLVRSEGYPKHSGIIKQVLQGTPGDM
ncbi:MAG TPA: hypothetical protein VNE41_11130 [Chitinophagaceae bacterium]|nr:hypothetical protein [Chitinophagaceae bacterium]